VAYPKNHVISFFFLSLVPSESEGGGGGFPAHAARRFLLTDRRQRRRTLPTRGRLPAVVRPIPRGRLRRQSGLFRRLAAVAASLAGKRLDLSGALRPPPATTASSLRAAAAAVLPPTAWIYISLARRARPCRSPAAGAAPRRLPLPSPPVSM